MQYKGCDVSIDKIKLLGTLSGCGIVYSFDSIDKWLTLNCPKWIEILNSSISYQAFKYRYAYSLRVKGTVEGVLFLCYYYNGDYRNQHHKPNQILIEFNPNKEGNLIYKRLAVFFRFKIQEVLSFDLAFDLPNAKISDITIKTRADIMTYGTVCNRTYYISPKCKGSGRVKIYDKKIERKNNNVDITQKLRIECSFKCPYLTYKNIHLTDSLTEELNRCCEHLNAISVSSRDSPSSWELFSLLHLDDVSRSVALSMMTYPTRKKYLDLIKQSSFCLDIDISSLLIIINNLLLPYTKGVL